jgi:NodT family efflux transporter outer membrane factor (OMF) lipoprotein
METHRPRYAGGADMPQGLDRLRKHGKRGAPACFLWLTAAALVGVSASGCTTLSEDINNGFKVGPNYKRPPAPAAQHWIDADDERVQSQPGDDSHWWTVFNDPVLNDLVQAAYGQNLTLREAGFPVQEARAQLGIARGEFFPQTQTMVGSEINRGVSVNVANRVATPTQWFGTWDYGFGVAWELDFWGRFRRAIEASEDTLNASVENYDDVLVLLISDVASNYVRHRVLEQQLAYAQANVKLQTEILQDAKARFKGGQATELDVNQAQANLSATETLIPQLEIALRQVNDQLCILLGIPAVELQAKLGTAPIPTAPTSVAVGIPADLLRRRPDVRRAEREAAAQCAMIGVADAEFYPQISVNATWGWSAQELKDLFAHGSIRGTIGPEFRWEILNYGRILHNVRFQDAHFQELMAHYQQTVVKADAEVEDGLARFLKSQEEAGHAKESVEAEQAAVKDAIAQYKGGIADFNRVAVVQEQLVSRQNELAQAEGEIALGLMQVYRALGGGWQIRCDPGAAPGNCEAAAPAAPAEPAAPVVPPPQETPTAAALLSPPAPPAWQPRSVPHWLSGRDRAAADVPTSLPPR